MQENGSALSALQEVRNLTFFEGENARVDPFPCFLYDEFHWALSSAVRAFGLHPKGRPFESDSAHHAIFGIF